ncbi:phage baseplate protein [Veillonella caviae]|uniref:phage baseplate protein n=1 Tax=Veillonella caviae TaxID=248316 RepID=UPI0023F14FB8|nr:hypothetical protein [Veillonella caviae]MCI6406967.1 hypothetical protein [Veillonella caviae]MDY6224362.1 hypothetical protein [Veillonella caviae]
MPLFNELITPSTIDTVEVDVLLSQEITYESEVTRYPVETGFEISDHVINKQPTLRLEVLFTPTPVTWYERRKEELETRMQDVRAELERIRNEAEPITVTLQDCIYENMVIVKLPFERTVRNGLSYKMTLEFVKIAVVSSNTADVPAEYVEQEQKILAQQQKTETNAGTATTTDIGDGGSGAVGTSETAGDSSESYAMGTEQTAGASKSILKSIFS